MTVRRVGVLSVLAGHGVRSVAGDGNGCAAPRPAHGPCGRHPHHLERGLLFGPAQRHRVRPIESR
eukprot:1194343-Prorocentrum_minimum.AAC.2